MTSFSNFALTRLRDGNYVCIEHGHVFTSNEALWLFGVDDAEPDVSLTDITVLLLRGKAYFFAAGDTLVKFHWEQGAYELFCAMGIKELEI